MFLYINMKFIDLLINNCKETQHTVKRTINNSTILESQKALVIYMTCV